MLLSALFVRSLGLVAEEKIDGYRLAALATVCLCWMHALAEIESPMRERLFMTAAPKPWVYLCRLPYLWFLI